MSNITSDAKQASLKGIGCMVLGGFFLTVNDAIQKWMTDDFPRGELLAVRGMFVMIPILFFAWRLGGLSTLRIHSRRGQAGARHSRLHDVVSVYYSVELDATGGRHRIDLREPIDTDRARRRGIRRTRWLAPLDGGPGRVFRRDQSCCVQEPGLCNGRRLFLWASRF